VATLFIDGVQQLEGIYEAVGNPGSGIETSSITGTGTLTVTGAGFDTWVSGDFANGNTVPSDKQGPNDDPDNDGIDNLTEYAVANLDPTVNNGSVGTFTGLTLSFAKRQPLAGDITYSIEESTDLGVSDAWAPSRPRSMIAPQSPTSCPAELPRTSCASRWCKTEAYDTLT
jgi:hypothetical protein